MQQIARILALSALSISAQAAFPTLYLKNVCDDQLHAPTNMTTAGDGSGRMFICDQPGKIFIFQGGMLNPTPFLDLTSTGVNKAISQGTGYSERGLLGMCFHPGFSNPASAGYRCFYVYYSAPNTRSHPVGNQVLAGATTNHVSVVEEYKVSATNPNSADTSTAREVLLFGQPQSNHNGGQLEFGPDGYLYIASGDGGGANDNPVGHTQGSGTSSAGRVTATLGNGQDRRNLWGKILRIDPLDPDGAGPLTYAIPATNPFVGLTQDFTDNSLDGPMRGEIYAYGLRNPWRFSFDSSFGGAARLICADVGQLDVEEIDFITSGGNYGWRIKEGTLDFDTSITAYSGGLPTTIAPIVEYAHPTALSGHGTLPGTSSMQRLGASITGGYVYRGTQIAGLAGKYLFADYAVAGITGGGGVLLGMEETSPGVFALNTGPLTVANPLPSTARVYCFGEDETGELYFATKTTSGVLTLDGGLPAGTIYKLQGVTTTNLTLNPSKDNTMYEGTNNSNGAGAHLYAGLTGAAGGETLRRALLRFDLSSIPAGTTLSSASLQLTTTKQVSQDYAYSVHKASVDWGEGGSNAGEPGGTGTTAAGADATWNRRFTSPLTNWTSPGGDYTATASATAAVGNLLTAPVTTWSSAGLLADVQGWVNSPSGNFGWVLRGDATTESNAYSAQRFASRQNTVVADRPKLNVSYAAAPTASRYEGWYGTYFPGQPIGSYLNPSGDNDADGIPNQVEYALNLSPLTHNAAAPLGLTRTDDSINTTVTVTFRRDPRATDVTYALEVSEDLLTWQTVASSSGGSAMSSTGTATVNESPISGESPMVLVTASADLAGIEIRNFLRLKITRAP